MFGLDFESTLQIIMAGVAFYVMYIAFTKDPF
jgi:hypothetical protein